MRRKLALTIGLLVSGLFLWLALRDTDFSAIGAALMLSDPRMVIPFLVCLFAFYWLKSGRWALLLSPVKIIAGRELFPVVMIGFAGTAILPMQLGELVRTYLAARRHALPVSLVFSSVVVERVFDLTTILALLAVVLATGQMTPDPLVKAGYAIAAVTVTAILVAAFFILQRDRAFKFLGFVLRPFPTGLRKAILNQAEAATRGLQSLASPRLVGRIAINSLVQWALMGICIFVSLRALSVDVPSSAAVLVLVATIIGISLPTSPGYFGNIQFAFVIALQPYGIDPAHAVAASVFYHVLAYLSVLLTGAWFAHRLGYRTSELDPEAGRPAGDLE